MSTTGPTKQKSPSRLDHLVGEDKETLDEIYAEAKSLEVTGPVGPPERRLVNYVLRTLDEIKQSEELIKAQSKKALGWCKSRRRALIWRYGRQLVANVKADIGRQKGSRKSVDYEFGSSGYKRSRLKIEVFDSEAAIDWCIENSINDGLEVVLKRTTPLLDHFKSTGEIPPGCQIHEPRDRFFPDVDDARLTDDEQAYLDSLEPTNENE